MNSPMAGQAASRMTDFTPEGPMQETSSGPDTAAPHSRSGMQWTLAIVLLTSITLATGLLILYLAPTLAVRWRELEDQQAANAVYLRREAELKAESEAADRQLARLDHRLQLV